MKISKYKWLFKKLGVLTSAITSIAIVATDIEPSDRATAKIAPINWTTEKDRFANFISTTNVATLTNNLKTISSDLTSESANVKNEFSNIAPSNYLTPSDLDTRVSVTRIVVQKALDTNTRQVMYRLTLSDGDGNTSIKDVTTTFAPNWTNEKTKLSDFVTSDELWKAPTVASNVDIKDNFTTLGNYKAPSFSSGIFISKVVVKTVVNAEREVAYKVTLGDGANIFEYDVIVTFAPNWTVEKAKLSDFTTSDRAYSIAAMLPKSDFYNAKTEFNDITLPKPRIPFAINVRITKVIVKSELNLLREVIYEVTLSDGTSSVKQDVKVTFAIDWIGEIIKLRDFVTSNELSEAPIATSSVNIKGDFTSLGNYNAPIFSSGVFISKVVVKKAVNKERKVVYEVTLSDGTNILEYDVIVTFAPNWAVEKSKFSKFITSNELSEAPAIASSVDIKDDFTSLGNYKTPSFSGGVFISKVVVKTAVNKNREVVYEVTLSDGTNILEYDVIVTFAPNWTYEKAKLINFVTSNELSEAPAIASSVDIKDDFTSLGNYKTPSFSGGVSISKVVVKTAVNKNREVVYEVALSDSANIFEYDVIVTFAPNWAVEKAKLSDFTTSDNADSIAANLPKSDLYNAKTEFDEITLPAPRIPFAANVQITKVIVKSELNLLREVIYEVTLSDGTSSLKQDVKVTFTIGWAREFIKLQDFVTSNELSEAPVVASSVDIKDDFTSLGNYKTPIFSSDVSIRKVVVKTAVNKEREVVYEVTLGGDANIFKYDVIVTFAPNWAIEKAKLSDFTTSDNADSIVANLPKSDDFDAKTEFDEITLPAPRIPFATNVQITKVIVKSELNLLREVVYEVTLSDGTTSVKQDVKVTFSISWFDELERLYDFVSTDLITSNAAILDADLNIDVREQFNNILKIPNWKFSEGVAIKKVIVKSQLDPITRQVIYQITLWDGNLDYRETKDVIVTFAPNWEDELAKLDDFESPDTIESTAAILEAKEDTNIKEKFEAINGYKTPNFLNGVSISKVIVKTKLNGNSRQVVYKITLKNGNLDYWETKDVVVTFAPNWEDELAKLDDFESPDTVESVAAILKADANANVKKEFEGITNYAKPLFSNGVSISKVIVKTKLNEDTRQVVYTITLKNGDQDHLTTKEVTVTFTHTLAFEANRIKNFITSDDLDVAKKFVENDKDFKTEFERITGYLKPIFANGVSIKSVAIKSSLDDNTRKVVFEVTLKKTNDESKIVQNHTKEVVVTFRPNFDREQNKFAKELISKRGIGSSLAQAAIGDDVTISFLKFGGLTLPKLAPGVLIKKVVVKTSLDDTNRKAIYDVTLWDTKSQHEPFEVTVEFATDMNAALNELNDFTSTDDTKLNIELMTISNDNIKDKFTKIAGFRQPIFAPNINISEVIVATSLNVKTRQVVYKITLEKTMVTKTDTPNEVATKNIIVTFAPDLDIEINKFKNFTTIDNDKSDAAMLEASEKNVKNTFDTITGYRAPKLEEGVAIKSIVVKRAINDRGQVVFTITLNFDQKSIEKDVVVTFTTKAIPKTNDEKLKTGSIIGIATGSSLGIGIIGFLIYYLFKRKK